MAGKGDGALLALLTKKPGGGESGMSAEDEAEAGAKYSKVDYDAGDASFESFAAALKKGDLRSAKASLKTFIASCGSSNEEE
jgi:hypothetical protein